MPRRPKYKTFWDGVLVVDKPVGVTSMDVVRRVRHSAGFCKTGHAGTLDPLASGVLVCCLGKATSLIDRLMAREKRYDASVDLSAFTTTDDAEGERTEVAVKSPPVLEEIEAACAGLTGTIMQRPPAYSAVHVDGQRAYAMARKGEAVELKARPVVVESIEVVRYAYPELELRVVCGKGVYIRSLARDLGEALGTGGSLSGLRRTAVLPFTLEDAVGVVGWERCGEPIGQADLIGLEALDELMDGESDASE
ncbi:MAG: tRNA pseudouridine(55) synthase TruB [Planctomycetota bacterium]